MNVPDANGAPQIIAAEEGGFIVRDPLTGMTTQGETLEEALANLKEAVDLFHEVCPPTPPA